VVVAAQPDPVLDVFEPGFGAWSFEGTDDPLVVLEVPAGEILNFSWQGDASGYGGTIEGYRYGWDVMDPNDPNDPGWATGFQPDLLSAPPQSFAGGVHNFYVVVIDDAGGMTWGGFQLEVQPPISLTTRSWGSVKAGFRD
jgi:hypothetical protein